MSTEDFKGMDKLDKSKALAKQRLNKPKVPAPPGELIALGSKPKADEPGLSSKAPVPSVRRDTQPPPSGSLLGKKTTVPFIPVSKAADLEKSSISQAQYDESAIDCPPAEFYDAVMAAYDGNDDEKIERLLCGAVRYLKNNRAKPDNQIALCLIYFAKAYPGMFTTDNVTAAFSSLLKRDPSASFKAKGNPIVMVLACNVMYIAFAAEEQWPDIFLKVFLEDSMGERIWVDRADCRCFTENVITAYGTKLPPRSMMTQDAVTPIVAGAPAATSLVSASTSPSSTPRAASGFPDDEPMELGSTASHLAVASGSGIMPERSDSADELSEPAVLPRYAYQQDATERQATEFVNEQLGKRQPVDTSSRQLLKTIATMCGVVDVRLAAVQRLEMWLQNPKLSRPAQDLLLFICFNCGQRSGGMGEPKELEVATQLLKLRLKNKQLLTHYLICLRELMNQNDHNLHTVVALTLYNELSNSRNSNNMAVLGTAVQVSSEKASAIFAEIFVDLLMNKEDYLRAVRTLLREIVRSIRNDVDFPAFCLALMAERKPEKFNELDASTKERLFASITDLIALSQLLCITPSVREAATGASKGDRRDVQAMRCFWKQVSTIQRDSIWWMQEIVPSSFELNKQDYLQGLYKILMMQPAESYYKVDGWPPEPERHTILRLATETPVREDTIIRILIVGLTTGLPLSATEALDVSDLMVRRAAVAATNIAGHVGIQGASLLEVSNLDLIQLLFNAAAYHHPENIKLPKGYEPPCLAIASSYWKVWQMLLIVSAFNPATFGRVTWESYETLRVMMEMTMTNNYRYPPPTISPDENVIQSYLQKERQAIEQEKQAILEFEGHLAAATSKSAITEQTSVLLSLLMSMEPAGHCRKPPDDVLESLKSMNKTMNLGSLLCRSRNPDFLLSIIERQGTVGSMPWLADLVEASEGSLDVLPVQCLCEFLLHDTPLPLVPPTPAVLSPDEATAAGALSARRKSSSSSVLSSLPAVRDSDTGDSVERISRSISLQTSKHDKLLARLRSMLFTPDTFGQAAVSSATEILGYFLQRLQLPASASRASALKGLAAVLGGAQRHRRDSAMDVDDDYKSAGGASQKFGWLLEDLPCIPAYRHVKALVIARLCEALRLETSVGAVEAFLTYVSRECLASDDQLLSRTIEAVSCILVERSGVLCGVLAQPSLNAAEGQADLQNGLLTVYTEFVHRACNPQWMPGSSYADKGSGLTSKIVVQWASGQSAVMGVAVLRATIILLAVCEPTSGTEHSDLCELWFPSGSRPPSIRWLDSEGLRGERSAEESDAQLCPDFLRLLMLRSSLPRLVDAAVDGLSVEKLLVFAQSFGIPVAGTRRLLQALDELSSAQPEVVLSAARARRDYLVELVEIQRARGVKEGAQFCSLLLADGGASSNISSHQSALTRSADPDMAFQKPVICRPNACNDQPAVDRDYERNSLVIMPESVDGMIEFIRQGLLVSGGHGSLATTRRLCRALQVKMAASESVRHIFLTACDKILKASMHALTQAFWAIATDIAPVLRLVIGLIRSSTKVRPPREAEAAAAASALFDALICSQPSDTSSGSGPLRSILVKAASWLRPSMDAHTDFDGIDIVGGDVERAVSSAVTDLVLSGKPEEAAKMCIQKINEAEQRSDTPPNMAAAATGLLVDWLQAVNLEVVAGAGISHSGTVDQEVLDLLFGRHQGRSSSCSAYLRAVLLHQASWDTVHAVVRRLVDDRDSCDSLDPSTVLDFLSGCIHHPKLNQGRVRKKPKRSQPDDVLGLASDSIECVAQLVVLEAAGQSSKSAAVESVDGRMELLCACCHEDTDKLRALARHVEARVLSSDHRCHSSTAGADTTADHAGDGSSDGQPLDDACAQQQRRRRAYEYLLVRLYAWAPHIIKWLRDDGAALDSDPAVLLHGPCALDAHTHKVLAALGAAVGAKKRNEVALNDANLLCRKVASDHPLLFLRQLPMMLALLSGRCDFTFGEFKHRNHLLLFTHVFGIAELLQPHVFVHPAFGDLVTLYLNFFREYGQKSLAPFFGKFVQLLHNFVHCNPSRMAQVLGGHSATLGYMCSVFPAMSQAKSLLSAVSLPQKEVPGAPRAEEKHAAMPVLNPPLTAEQLAPFRARLNKDASADDVIAVLKDIDSTSMIKVDILANFIDDLKRLLSAGNDECRNTAHSLMMRCLRHNPRCARDFVDSYAVCLEHESSDVKKSALLNLAEFTVLCDEDDATALLQRAFVAAMKLDGNESMTHVKEALQLLNLENVQIM